MVWLEVVESRNQAGVILCWLSVEDAVFVDCVIVLGSRFVVLFTRLCSFVLHFLVWNCPGFFELFLLVLFLCGRVCFSLM